MSDRISAIDLPATAKADPLPSPRILLLALELDIQGYRLRDIPNREITRKLEMLLITFYSRAAERDLRVNLGVEKVS